jgi:NADH-quinone oxidoreductase subunit D
MLTQKIRTEELDVNMGPQHPSTHGVMRIVLTLDGEVIKRARPVIGYLHRGMEKIAERRTYFQYTPLCDRFDYLASMLNGALYTMTLEKLAQMEVPPKAEYIRVILMELNRLSSHLVFAGTLGLDLGATTPFIYCFRERETITDLFEMAAGARMTFNYMRPGGVAHDLPPEFEAKCRAFLKDMPGKIDEYEGLLTKNEIFQDRMVGIGAISREDALGFSLTGPALRGSGVNYDVRRFEPYSVYNEFDFEVPVKQAGDCFARYECRMEEMRQSLRIIEQALDGIPEGAHSTKINMNFKLPAGEAYCHIESARGDMGCYIVSDGKTSPVRMKWRAPSFSNISILSKLLPGWKVADAVAIIGSLDVVLGEVDR